MRYLTTTTDSGQWKHAPSSDFVFAYIDEDWTPAEKIAVGQAFEAAEQMSNKIKQAVLATSGQTVVNGLYLLDQPAMTEAMNSISGMGETAATQHTLSGDGTALSVTDDFFGQVLAGLGGDISPMLDYLTVALGKVQAQTVNTTVTSTFGTVVGLVSLMPDLDIPVTSFVYLFSEASTTTQFQQFLCGSSTTYTYDIDYTAVTYNYVDPTP